MRALAVLLLLPGLAMGVAAPAKAGQTLSTLPEADRTAIRTVIEEQMQAFRADDAPAAFAFASPAIQAQFGDAGNFLDMVRSGYRPVYRPRTHFFGPLIELDGRPVQKVEVVGPDGQNELALYFMEHEPDGSWRVSGCLLTETAGVGA